MPAYGEKYGPKLRETLFRMAIDENMGVAGALAALNGGPVAGLDELERNDLAGMNYSYACTLVKAERQSRAYVATARAGLVDDALAQAARLMALADRTIRQLETKREKAPVDIDAGIRAAKLSKEALALARAANDGVKAEPKGKAEQGTEAKAPQSLAQRIAASASTELDDNHTTTNAGEASATPTISDDGSATDAANGSPARVSAAPAGLQTTAALVRVAVPAP